MFARPGFQQSRKADDLPIIHEEADQNIQGGLPGEHYHLSSDLLVNLVRLVNTGGSYFHVVVSNTTELMHSISGDVMETGLLF